MTVNIIIVTFLKFFMPKDKQLRQTGVSALPKNKKK